MDYLRVKRIIMLMATNNLLDASSNLEELAQVISDMVNGKANPMKSIRFIQQLVAALSVLGKSKPASSLPSDIDTASGFMESINAEWLWATITETIEAAANATMNNAKILGVEIEEQVITESLANIMQSKLTSGMIDDTDEVISELDKLTAIIMEATSAIEETVTANMDMIAPNDMQGITDELDLVTSAIVKALVKGILAQTSDSDTAEASGNIKEALRLFSTTNDSDTLAAALILYCHRTIADLKVATIVSLKNDLVYEIKFKEKS